MKLYAGNLPLEMTEEELKELFSEYGEVISVNIVFNYDINQSKGFGFVQFESKEDAMAAMEGLNGKEVNGRGIKVSEAKPKTGSRRGAANRGKGGRDGNRRFDQRAKNSRGSNWKGGRNRRFGGPSEREFGQ